MIEVSSVEEREGRGKAASEWSAIDPDELKETVAKYQKQKESWRESQGPGGRG